MTQDDFCGEHVAEEHRAACAPAIAAQVENELKVRKQLAGLPPLELEVQVGEEKTVFRHRDGGDVRAEASAFCEKYVADEQVAACAAHLVEGALQAAARPKRDPLEAEEPESAWDRLLGPQLVAAGGKTVSVDAALAKKKNVALLFAAVPEAEYDSWLTVGVTDGSAAAAIASTGIDFASWTESAGLESTNGAVFWMDPWSGPSGSASKTLVLREFGRRPRLSWGMWKRRKCAALPFYSALR